MKQLYLLLITLLVSLSAYAEKSGTCGDNLQWKLTDEGVLTITGTGEMQDWHKSKPSPWHADKSVKQVIIGDGVTTIGSDAFRECSFLTSVTIPNSVTTISSDAFSYCRSLTSVTIGNGVRTIEGGAFSYCSSLASITIPNSVTDIGSSAFSGCSSLTSITIPNSVTKILGETFSGCSSLTSITIPNSVTTIGGGTFYDCRSLTSITIPNSVITIEREAFSSCSSLTSITIPNGVTTIGTGAFYDCSSLASVTIGKSVTSIASVFDYTSEYKKVIWLTNTPPRGYQSVGGKFHYVPNTSYRELSNAKVYPSLSSMFEVGGIKYVPVSPSERTCNAIDCIYTENANEVNIDKKVSYKGFDMTVIDINPYTFSRNKYIKKANININGSIGWGAFSGCPSLTSVTIGNSVKTIGHEAFYSCSSLSSLTIPNSVTEIGFNTFSGCSSLTSVTIPTSVTTIERGTFSGCPSLTSVSIGNSVKTIGERAFSGCSSLTSVSIGNSVKTIGSSSFYNCVNIMQISCDAVLPPSCSTNLFEPINKWECKLIVPKNSIDAYKKANGWKEFFLIEGSTTGIINNIYNKTENVDVYTIDGVKCLSKASVNEINALPKGVYIVNGKKIVIK